MKAPPPLRFLAAVVGGWACFRAAMLAPAWMGDVAMADPPPMPPAHERWRRAGEAPIPPRAVVAATEAGCRSCEIEVRPVAPMAGRVAAASSPVLPPPFATAPVAAGRAVREGNNTQFPGGVAPIQVWMPEPGPLPKAAAPGRWSASAWAFVRRGEERSLAAGGMLGGSQAGARFGYRVNNDVNRPLALSARFYAPVGGRSGAEAAFGVEWKPLARLPVRLLAERRQAIGRDGRSAFSLMAHGGVADWKLTGPVRLNAYAQAGIVGARSRDLFADGSAILGVAMDGSASVTLGAGIWGATQPGASRLDVGPSLGLRVPVQQRSLRISADWRIRVSGNAAPGSGPALTVGTDF